MKKYNISDLVIECTRRCNMFCGHCVRGEPQDMDMNMNIIDRLFKQVEYISHMALSGGEPSLVPEILMKIIELAKNNNVNISTFYIATNAKKVSDEFLRSLFEWYIFCQDDDEMNCVEISDDAYHEEINHNNIRKLRAFRFVSTRQRDRVNLIRQGRAASLNFTCRDEETPSTIDIEDFNNESNIDGTLYLDCKGNIHSNCDISYETMDEGVFKIGNIMDKRFDLGRAINKYNLKFKLEV